MERNHDGPEYRSVEQIRAADGDSGRTLDVTFARFNVWNEIQSYWEGNFLERLTPGAFTSTFEDRRDRIRCLFNHGRDPAIGNKPLGQVTDLRETSDGPHGTVDLFDRDYVDDVLAGLRCDPPVYGASYRFGVVEESWNDEPGVSEHNPKGIPERTIQRVNVAEFGPVTFPADEGTQELIGVRSLSDHFATPPPVSGTEIVSSERGETAPAGAPAAPPDTKGQTATAFALAARRRQQR